jgi:hypothetical protein
MQVFAIKSSASQGCGTMPQLGSDERLRSLGKCPKVEITAVKTCRAGASINHLISYLFFLFTGASGPRKKLRIRAQVGLANFLSFSFFALYSTRKT